MTRRPIRVLHVLGSLNPGGVETWLMNVLRHIDRTRFKFHFCTFGPEPGILAPEAEQLGARVIPCPKGKNVWSLARRFRKILRDGHYDVVHSHVLYFSGAVLRWADSEGVPARIAHAHSTSDGKQSRPLRGVYRKQMSAWIKRHATLRLAASPDAAASLFGPAWREDAQLLYYGLDFRPFAAEVNRGELRRELGIPCDVPVVGHVGRFVEAKNHRFLLQVAAELLSGRPETNFLLVGGGPLRASIEAAAQKLPRANQIHFVGARTDVPRLLLGAMDAFLFPSLWEGLGLAVVEAQAAGLPCLVSDSVPRDSAVVPGLVEFRSLADGAGAWATALPSLLSQPRHGPAARLRAFEQSPFRIECSVQELRELYAAGKAASLVSC